MISPQPWLIASVFVVACAHQSEAVSTLSVTSVTAPTNAQTDERRALALYGRAHTLDAAGRCDEAKVAYEQYASAVRGSDPASAEMARSYEHTCWTHAQIDPALTNAVSASLAHDDARALALLDADTNDGPWQKYDRAVALAGLHRVDDSAQAFDAARDRFARDGDARGRAISVYGKARAYHDALRCAEAWSAYSEYAGLVRATSPADSALALDYARDCVKR